MSLPLPSEFAALVPVDPNNATCSELRALLNKETGLQALLNRWWSSWFNESGTLTTAFTNTICDIACVTPPPPGPPLPSSCLDDARVSCGLLTVGIENGTGIFFNKGWGHSVALNNTENYYAEFTPISGINNNSIHFGIVQDNHKPCLDFWDYGCLYRFDGHGFRNGINAPPFFIAPAMVMGATYGVLYRGPEQKVTFLKNNVAFQTVSLSVGAPAAPLNTAYKYWIYNVANGMCSGNFGPVSAFIYDPSSLMVGGVSISARAICDTPGGSVSTTTGGSVSTTTVFAPAPSAYWRMEETGANDNRIDATGNGHHLTASGVAFVAGGKANGGCQLQGTLELNPAGMIGGSFTIVGWVYVVPSYLRTFLRIANGPNAKLEAQFSHNSTAVSFKLLGDGVTVSHPDKPSTNWFMVAITFTGTTAKLFLNGSAGPVTVTPIAGVPDRFSLCINEGDNTDLKLDEWQVYDSVLSAVDIDYLYNAGAGRFYPY